MPQEQDRVYLGSWVSRGSDVCLDSLLAFVVSLVIATDVKGQPVSNQKCYLIEVCHAFQIIGLTFASDRIWEGKTSRQFSLVEEG